MKIGIFDKLFKSEEIPDHFNYHSMSQAEIEELVEAKLKEYTASIHSVTEQSNSNYTVN